VYVLSSLRAVAFILAQPSEIDDLLGEARVLQQRVQRYRNNFRDSRLPRLLVNQVRRSLWQPGFRFRETNAEIT